MAAAAADDPREAVSQILEWIGFDDEDEREAILDEGFEDWDDIYNLQNSDIESLQKGFARREGNNRILFGLKRTKRLKHMVLWVQDFYRCDENPDVEDLDEVSFLSALSTASERSEIRKSLSDQADSTGRESSPGKFKDESKWNTWKEGLANYLATQIGSFGVPLSYVIREREEGDGDDHTESDFIEKCVLCAPLNGAHYEADKRQVHQLIYGLVQGETAESWIKKLRTKNDGRRDYMALVAHYSGEGNTNRRLATADHLRDTLHYKSQRAVPFETFLQRAEEMFIIYEEETTSGYSDEDKVRWLLPKVQHPSLAATIAAIKARDADGAVSYQYAINLLAAEVATLPETVALKSRNISALGTRRSQGGIYNEDGTIFTGYFKNWGSLSKEDKDLVNAERANKGVVKNPKKKPDSKDKKIAALTKVVNKIQRKVAAVKRNKKGNNKVDEDIDSDDSDSVPDDAGNQFGGRSAKQKSKKKKKKES